MNKQWLQKAWAETSRRRMHSGQILERAAPPKETDTQTVLGSVSESILRISLVLCRQSAKRQIQCQGNNNQNI